MANKGDIPAARYVCHTCDRGSCVNPEHLVLDTPRNNMLYANKDKTRLPGVSWHEFSKRWMVVPIIKGKKVCLYGGKDLFEACCVLKSFHNSLEG